MRAKAINEEMKVAAANAIALLARENVPDEVVAAYGGDRPRYGKNYIIPSTFDPRLISVIPAAVAEAAIKSGAARKKIEDFELYKDQLSNRLDPSMSLMQGINAKIRKNPKRVIFAEGEDENMLKAAIEFGKNKLGIPILIGAENRVKEQLKKIGLSIDWEREISTCSEKYYKHQQLFFLELYKKGLVYRKENYVNWDPVDQTVLANEQVIDGKGWRSGAVVERKKLNQWFFKISKFKFSGVKSFITLDKFRKLF